MNIKPILLLILIVGSLAMAGCIGDFEIPLIRNIYCPPGEVANRFQPESEAGDLIEERYPLSEAKGKLKVTSGGQAFLTPQGRLLTLKGYIDGSNRWYNLYSKNSDTLFGKRPQNIFRAYVETCPLPSRGGFYIEISALATDYEAPIGAAYPGGVDVIAQWWSPHNPNEAFGCKDQYGGFCSNVGYHTKAQSNGGFEISKERPAGDSDVAHRYQSLRREANALETSGNEFPLNKPVRLRMEIEESGGGILITSCLDKDANGTWDLKLMAEDYVHPSTGSFVPILRSDWMSTEFFDPRIGAFGAGERSCAE